MKLRRTKKLCHFLGHSVHGHVCIIYTVLLAGYNHTNTMKSDISQSFNDYLQSQFYRVQEASSTCTVYTICTESVCKQ